MRVDLRRLREAQNFDQINRIVRDIISESNESGDLIYISDLVADESVHATIMMEELRKDHSKKYKLQVIRDKWGVSVSPGDKVRRVFKQSLFRSPGTPHRMETLSGAVKRGEWEKEFCRFELFDVDNKGCITCSADDMFYFLSHYGVHGKNKDQRISFHVNETSSDPKKRPEKGDMKHVWYRRYREVDSEEYNNLKRVKKEQ